MKIVFSNKEENCDIGITRLHDDVLLSIKNTNPITETYKSTDYTMCKAELRDFIGALLHLQQQLNKTT